MPSVGFDGDPPSVQLSDSAFEMTGLGELYTGEFNL